MNGLKNKIMSSDSMKNISNVRTPMTPENKTRRLVLLIIGLCLIIAGIIVWIVSCSSQQTYSLAPETQVSAITETTASN